MMAVRKIRLLDKDSNSIYESYLLELPIKEQCILSESKKVFNDSEPCIIHRNYVIKKICIELANWLEDIKSLEGSVISDENNVAYLLSFLDVKACAKQIEII